MTDNRKIKNYYKLSNLAFGNMSEGVLNFVSKFFPQKFRQNMAGFTLLETVVAIGIVVVGLASALALLSSSVSAVAVVRQRIAAANLVQEGIEVTRNIRDTNWLKGFPWNQGLANGDYQVEWSSSALVPYGDTFLLFDSTSNLYNYTTGNPTEFKRRIKITNLSAIEMMVEVTVTWDNRGRALTVAAEDHLFDWK